MVVFTKEGYEQLMKAVGETREKLQEIIEEKATSAHGSDGWHDETFRACAVQEEIWSKKLGQLQRLVADAKVVEPEEQNSTVQFGTGVVIEYEDGRERKIVLQGYQISHFKGIVSVHSPLGRALAGAQLGEERTFKVENMERKVRVKRILPPSQATTLLHSHSGR